MAWNKNHFNLVSEHIAAVRARYSTDQAALDKALRKVDECAAGDSNDEEIEALNDALDIATSTPQMITDVLDTLSASLADAFKPLNDGFKRERFYDACGVAEDSPIRTTH